MGAYVAVVTSTHYCAALQDLTCRGIERGKVTAQLDYIQLPLCSYGMITPSSINSIARVVAQVAVTNFLSCTLFLCWVLRLSYILLSLVDRP